MCGINVIINKKPIPVSELNRMQQATQYRGPDNSAVLNFSTEAWNIAVGVSRLMVVDKDPKANQPIVSACGNYVLAYNGETYNYQDLKNVLISKGYTFYSHSDTEVVLNWLKEKGPDGINDLKGMFALVFVDLKRETIAWSRDKQGIKPLFIFTSREKIIISSAVEGIKASNISLTINKGSIGEYLRYRHVLGQNSFYNEISSLAPGVVNTLSKSFKITSEKICDRNPYTGNLKEALIDSVALAYQAASQPGLLLSGGVDSTLLLAILNKELGISGAPVYTLNTGEDDYWAKKAATLYRASHFEVIIEPPSFDRIEEFLTKTDQPIADHGAMANWLVAEKAKENSNVLLSGAGADELFGGYNRHIAFKKYLKARELFLFLKQVLRSTGAVNLLPRQYQKAILAFNKNPKITFQNFLHNYSVEIDEKSSLDFSSIISPEKQYCEALRFDQHNFLINDVLAISDNAAMQQGVEIRVPYLYDDIVAFIDQGTDLQRYKNAGKIELKELLASYGGIKFTKRRKAGFGLPLASWFRTKHSFHHWEFLAQENEIYRYLKHDQITELVKDHQDGRRDNNMQLWSILVLENWLRRS